MVRVCVYCGSSPGNRPEYADTTRAFCNVAADRGWDLVYGGGTVGLMGIAADTMLARGRHVIGVIPHSLFDKEVVHRGVSELVEVDSMHERKAAMAHHADAFVALPGGLGTLEEVFEALTWTQLRIHAKPCGLLNASGYYDELLAFLCHTAREGFVNQASLDLVVVEADPERMCDSLEERLRL